MEELENFLKGLSLSMSNTAYNMSEAEKLKLVLAIVELSYKYNVDVKDVIERIKNVRELLSNPSI